MTTDIRSTEPIVPSPWRLLLSATGRVFLWFVPVALIVTSVQTLQHHHLIISDYWGTVTGLCVWKGIRDAHLSVRAGAKAFIPRWIAVIWSLLLTASLSILYQICEVAVWLVIRFDLVGILRLPRMMSAWWPDPSQGGYPFFILAVLFIEPFVVGAALIGSALAFLFPHSSRKQQRSS